MDRIMFQWEVPMQSSSGEAITERVAAFWSPSFDLTKESVEEAAASQCRMRAYKKGGAAAKVAYAVVGDAQLVTA